jgi:hypothetical protein
VIKVLLIAVLAAISIVACGGGGDSVGSQPAAKKLTISMYGKPLVSASPTAHQLLSAVSKAASQPDAGTSDAQVTVQTLQDALAARGVTANVTAQVMDGTTLHQIVMGENNGLPPTPDQFKLDPSEWMIVNFQLDDMATPWSDPTQKAAVDQFVQDLTVFSQRAAVAGKAVFAVAAISTCDNQYSAAQGVNSGLARALVAGAPIRVIGQIPLTVGFDTSGNAIPSPDLAHLGADCRTPDTFLLNERVQSVADSIAAGYKESGATPSPASGASATGT